MCGISGIIDLKSRPVSPEQLRRMTDQLSHRGPDDHGIWIDGPVGLGHRRLSIIDLAGGHQPLCNEDGNIRIVFNGEIYNFPELREQLEKKGHQFQTHSDTEAIAHAYEEWGADCPKYLRGMFAFAIWDKRHQTLFLARDRCGKKPLLYVMSEGKFLFASEFQSLLTDPDVSRRIHLPALDAYLATTYVPAPLTAYQDIKKLPPAHTLTLKNGEIKIDCYWRLEPFFDAGQKLKITEAEAAEELLHRLREAVQIRLMSEVPLGAFLSGGIDSSAVVALMATLSDKPIKTFSIGFEESDFSETIHARRVAEKYGCDHHEIFVKPDAMAILSTLVRHYGEPYGDSSAVPTFYVSQAARRHVTVALNGDGGDEVFAGYERYRAMRLTEQIPSWLLRGGARAIGAMPKQVNLFGRRARLERTLRASTLKSAQRYLRWQSVFSVEQKHHLYTDEFQKAVGFPETRHPLCQYFEIEGIDIVDACQLADTMTYLPDDLLAKVDITSMANSLEGRSPFLDHPLMEWAARLPVNLKLRGSTGKYILRRAIKDLVPAENMQRRKMGFGIPVGHWFRNELKELLYETVVSQRALARGYFKPNVVRGFVEEHISGHTDHSFRLWTLLMLELWHQEFTE